jgi:hypothetical protein
MNVANGGEQHVTARLVLFLLIAAGRGCAVVGGIFKGGVVVGIVITVLVVILLFMLFGRR